MNEHQRIRRSALAFVFLLVTLGVSESLAQRLSSTEFDDYIQILEVKEYSDSQDIALRRVRDSGPDAKPLTPVIRELVQDSSRNVYLRRLAAETLAKINAVDDQSVQVLAGVLIEGNGKLAAQAAISLGEMGPEAVGAVNALAEALTMPSGSQTLWREAAYALSQIKHGAEIGIPALCWRLTRCGGDHETIVDISDSLSKMGFASYQALPALSQALREVRDGSITFRHLANVFATISTQITNRLHLLTLWDLHTTHRVIEKGIQELDRSELEEVISATVTVREVMRVTQHEQDSRASYKIINWFGCLTLMAFALATMWLLLATYRPCFVLNTARLLKGIALQDIWKLKFTKPLKIGTLFSYLILLHYFVRRAEARKTRTSLKVKTAKCEIHDAVNHSRY